MHTIVYDGSFEGWLTAVFEIYEYKLNTVVIYRNTAASPGLFGDTMVINTQAAKAERVYQKLKEKLTPVALQQVYKTFLSEIPGIENHLLGYVKYILSEKGSVENNYSHPDVLMVQQTSRKVVREKHRMEAFVRFQLTKDGLYYSIIQPDYDVLPLINRHFTQRYADQRWLIYDAKRRYGLYYDLSGTSEVMMNFEIDRNDTKSLATVHDQQEEIYQQLWQQYFSSVNIAARKNMKLHIQHMPRRYWRFLVEKMPRK
jgi:probable DNA metabolism protein